MANAWREAYEDPLRWKCVASGQQFQSSGTPQANTLTTDMCDTKLVVMHRPTHDAKSEKNGEYPFSAHLAKRRRLWEIRMQVRFKQVPQGRLLFGIELGNYVPVSGAARQVQKALVNACKNVVGDCYHSLGDDPAQAAVKGQEVEPPTFVMPLWAFDQFHVTDAGQNPPDITGDLEGVGLKRADNVSKYIENIKSVTANLSTEKVYTFCFWGVSQFLDALNWEICGLLPGIRLDFNRLCGSPPVYISMYELTGIPPKEKGSDRRHTASRKKYFVKASAWSTLKPPPQGDQIAAVAAPIEDTPELTQALASLDLLGLNDDPADQTGSGIGASNATSGVSCDLLGMDLLDFGDPVGGGYGATPAPAKAPENVDLLGLF